MTRKLAIASLFVFLLATPAIAAKERGNRTKCSNTATKCVTKLDNIGSSGCDGISRLDGQWRDVVQGLLDAGDREGAAKIGARVVKIARHRGHVTVLKLQQTADTCVTKLRKTCPKLSGDFIEAVRAAEKKNIEAIERAEFIIDSFFDI